MLQQFKEDLEN